MRLFDSEAAVLSTDQRAQYSDPDRFETTSHLLAAVTETVVTSSSITSDSQALTGQLRATLHNDLEYSAADVRACGRRTARGDPYTAIFHRVDGGWVKDLTLVVDGEHGYRRHDEPERAAPSGAARYLDALWTTDDPITAAATAYHGLKAFTWEQATPAAVRQALDWISTGNDHIVVDTPRGRGVVGYTAPAAKELARLQDATDRTTFTEEMRLVVAATEAYHNSPAPYLEIQLQDDTLVPIPTNTYRGPATLYTS
jgi:hypothetical protein